MDKIDKVRSALGTSYKTELHYMRPWDGAYPPLANGTKAVNILAGDRTARCVAQA